MEKKLPVLRTLPLLRKSDIAFLGDRRLRRAFVRQFDIPPSSSSSSAQQAFDERLRPDVEAKIGHIFRASGYSEHVAPDCIRIIVDYLGFECEAEVQVYRSKDMRTFAMRRALAVQQWTPWAWKYFAEPVAVSEGDLDLHENDDTFGLVLDSPHDTPEGLDPEQHGALILLRIVYDVTKALCVAHSNGVAWRSIRKNAIRIVGNLSATDPLPLVKLVPNKQLSPFGETSPETPPKGYRPPEHSKGCKTHPSYDVWQLGVFILELFMNCDLRKVTDADRESIFDGRAPAAPPANQRWRGEGETKAWVAYYNWLREVSMSSPALRKLTMRMLHENPNQRPSAYDVLAALECIILESTSRPPHREMLQSIFRHCPVRPIAQDVLRRCTEPYATAPIDEFAVIDSQPAGGAPVTCTKIQERPAPPGNRFTIPAALSHNLLPEIPEKAIESKWAELASGKTELSRRFLGTLTLGAGHRVPVLIKRFYPGAKEEYAWERDSTIMNLSKDGYKEFAIHCYGCNNKNLWLVFALLATDVEVAVDEGIKTRNRVTTLQKMYILHDAARALEAMARPSSDTITFRTRKTNQPGKHREVVMQHRDVCMANLVADPAFRQTINDTKLTDAAQLDTLPPVVYLGDAGCMHSKSQSFKSGSTGHVYHAPPGCVEDASEYDEAVDVWRFGLLCYEVWTEQPWEGVTVGDRERICLKRLKPKENSVHGMTYSAKWTGEPPVAAPAVLYELVQVGMWHIEWEKRPSAKVVRMAMRWLLEDALIADNRLPPRDRKLPKSDDAEAVLLHLGYKVHHFGTKSQLPPMRKQPPDADEA